MRKLKKTCKKDKGLKVRLEREKFLDQLKNPQKYVKKEQRSPDEILAKIRTRKKSFMPNPYMTKIKRMAGLE